MFWLWLDESLVSEGPKKRLRAACLSHPSTELTMTRRPPERGQKCTEWWWEVGGGCRGYLCVWERMRRTGVLIWDSAVLRWLIYYVKPYFKMYLFSHDGNIFVKSSVISWCLPLVSETGSWTSLWANGKSATSQVPYTKWRSICIITYTEAILRGKKPQGLK